MTDAPAALLVDDADGIRVITFNRPEAKNALTVAMRTELCDLLIDSDADPAVRVVILTGTDPVFTAGVDFKERQVVDRRRRQFTVNPGRALRSMRTPTICAVNGACVSGGLEIMLSASFAVASERARFADTHARLNAVATWGLTALLPRAVGVRKAREMSITGDFVDAEEAGRIGLVNHVVAHETLHSFTRDLAGRVADTPAVTDVLTIYRQGEDLGLDAALNLETRTTTHRTFDADAFRATGEAVAARQRSQASTRTEDPQPDL
jgi:enoyl-CoA hydratase